MALAHDNYPGCALVQGGASAECGCGRWPHPQELRALTMSDAHNQHLYGQDGVTRMEGRPSSPGCCKAWLKSSVAVLQLADKHGVEAVGGWQEGLGRCEV